jgi:hypothetical protein
MEIIAERTGRFRVSRDLQNGLIKAELQGFWEVGDAAAFGPAVMKATNEVAARHGRISLIVDASDAPVQMSDVIEQSSSWSHALSSPGNRVAVIVSSSLTKLQIARRISEKSDDIRFFTSAEAAEHWLRADVTAVA